MKSSTFRMVIWGLAVLSVWLNNLESIAQPCIPINLGPDFSYACAQSCTTLNAHPLRQNATTSYTVSATSYTPYPFNAGATIAFSGADQWSAAVAIPFPFCFMGSTFNSLVIGENGVLSFDVAVASQTCNWQQQSIPFTGNTQPNNVPYPHMAIFGPYHDLDILSGGTIRYQTVGAFPCRRFVVSYNNVPHYNCPGLTSTFQIVLHELSNQVDVFIQNKSSCGSWQGGNAIEGIQNSNGTVSYTVPGRNATVWAVLNDAYSFIPSGAPLYTIQWQALGSGPLAVSGDSVQVCSPVTTTYVATIQYACVPVAISFSDTITVARPPFPHVVVNSTTPPDCNGGNNGSIQISGAGGLPSYQFKLGSGAYQASGSFGGLTAGSYVFWVKDANGCEKDTTVVLAQPPAIQATATVQPASCNGAATVTLNATGGTPGYTYALNTGAYQASNIFASVAPGIHTFHVKDSKGCVQDVPVTVPGATGVLFAGLTITPAMCNGGTVQVIVSGFGGLPAYQFAVDGGVYQTNNVFAVLAGNHTFSVKDAAGCTDDTTLLITQPPILTVAASVAQPGCITGTGTVTLTGSGGTAPFTYALGANAYGFNNIFANVPAGTYMFHVKDANNCVKDTLITLLSQSPVMAHATITPAGCSNNLGSILSTPFGGQVPYTFQLNGIGTYQPSGSFTGLSAGTYTLSVKDANGCLKDTVVVIPMSPTLAVTGNVTSVSCFGLTDGAFTLSATGGTAPYLFSVNLAAFSAVTVYTNKPAGAYDVVVKDQQGCEAGVTLQVPGPTSPLKAVVSLAGFNCNNSTGTINVTATGGAGPYIYALDAGQYGPVGTFPSLTPGTYTVHVKDAGNCQKDSIVTIVLPAALKITGLSGASIACYGGLANVQVSASGGTPPYTYAFGVGSYSGSNVLNMPVGSQTIHVKDAQQCIKDTTILLTQPPPIGIAVSYPAIVCAGNTTTITVQGSGSSGYTYALNSGAFSAVNTFPAQTAGGYTAHVKDAQNCVRDSTFNIVQPPVLRLAMAVTPVYCTGDSALIVLSGSGGNGGYSYALSPGGYSSSATYKVPAGTYTFSVKDNSNCQKDSTLVLVNGINISATYNIVPVLCNGNSNGSITVFPGVGAGPFEYALNNGVFSSNNNFTNLPLGSYTVKVKDANGCRKDTVIVLTPISDISIGVAVSPPTCYGQSNASVAITIISGGQAPYQSAIGSGTYSSGFTYPNLAPGTYLFHIRDSIKCIKDTLIHIVQPAPVTATIQLVNIGCNGNNNGSIQVFPAGGVPPYQYALNSGAFGPGNVFGGLNAGTYTVHIKDNNNCLKDTVVVLIQPPALRLDSVKIIPLSCNGGSNASAAVFGSGGAPPYQYAVDGGMYTSTSVFGSLGAGVHLFSIKDNGGCTKDTLINLAQPLPVQVTVTSVVNVPCSGGNNGSVTLVGSGGTAPYQYAVNTGVYGSSNVFGGLAPGSYVFHVKDASSCVKDTTVAIVQPGGILWQSVTVVAVSCAGLSDGSITVTATGGGGGFQYAMGTGAYGASNVFAGLPLGTYTLHAKDVNGCIKDTVVSFAQPLPLGVGVVVNAVTCTGNLADGKITVQATGGTAPYQYALNAGAFGSANIFNGLAPGSYTVHIKDLHNCLKDTTLLLLPPVAIKIDSAQVTGITCFGQGNGSVKLFASAGLPPYQYNVNGGTFTTNSLFTNLAAGSYTFSVKGSNGCAKDTTITLAQPLALVVASVTVTAVSCRNGANGSITITGAGGTPAYTYALGSGLYSSTNVFTGLQAGSYILHIKDARNCIKDTTITLVAPPAIFIQAVTVTPVLCNGDTTGSLVILASGGTGVLQYAINNNAYQAGNSFSNLVAAAYTLHVKDGNGCIKDTVVNIAQPAAIAPAVQVKNITCSGSLSDGSITVAPTGGVAPYVYALDAGAYGSVNQFNNLTAGTYTIHIKDANGCEKDTVVTLLNPADIALTAQVVPVTCFGGNDGQIALTITGGTSPYTYQLSTGQQYGPVPNTAYTFTGLGAANNVQVRITDQNGCVDDTTVSITSPAAIVLNAQVSDMACYGIIDGSIAIHATGGNGQFEYGLSQNDLQADAVFYNLAGGHYIVYVKDIKGCRAEIPVVLNAPDAPLSVDMDIDSVFCTGPGNDGAITALIKGGTSPYTYIWSTGDVTLKISNLPEGAYTLYVTDSKGCKDTALAQVGSRGCCQVHVPNAFTPNNDETNDWFRVLNYGRVYEFEMMVYNRLGQQVFASVDPEKGWDGRFLGQPAEIGTYYYMIRYRCEIDHQKKLMKGDVILIR